MSDAVSNTEIEDVLSSIRRLVADDAKKKAPKSAAPDRLVLTPSLRIKDLNSGKPAQQSEQAVPENPVSDSETQDRQADAFGVGAIVEQEVFAALDALQTGVAPEDEPDLSAVVAEAVSETGIVVELVADETADAPETPDAAEINAAPEANVLERKIAALEQLVSQNTGDWVQEEDIEDSHPLFQHNPPRALDWKADIVDDSPEPQPGTVATEPPEDDANRADENQPQEQAEDHADTPFVVTQIFRSEHQSTAPEADETVQPDRQDDPREGETAASQSPIIQQDSDDPIQVAPVENLLAESSLTIDEDMLRDLVGDLVRQELQGALGERITRNVRKLVRREIQRVLVAKDFE